MSGGKFRRRRRQGQHRPSWAEAEKFGQFGIDRVSSSVKGVNFEKKVAEILTQLGWDTELTPRSNDRGCDIFCRCGHETLVVQCKEWSGAVGIGAVQEIHLAKTLFKAGKAAVITRRNFTTAAKSTARLSGVDLFLFEELRLTCSLDRSAEGRRIKEQQDAQRREHQKRQYEREAAMERERQVEERVREDLRLRETWKKYDGEKESYKIKREKAPFIIILLLSVMYIDLFELKNYGTGWRIILGSGVIMALVIAYKHFFSRGAPTPPSEPRPIGQADASNERGIDIFAHLKVPAVVSNPWNVVRSSTSSPNPSGQRQTILCVHCGIPLRLPGGRTGSVRCPVCKQSAWYSTIASP